MGRIFFSKNSMPAWSGSVAAPRNKTPAVNAMADARERTVGPTVVFTCAANGRLKYARHSRKNQSVCCRLDEQARRPTRRTTRFSAPKSEVADFVLKNDSA